jgi:RNA polymerase sigma factor (sigma-70 family)
MAAPFGRRSRRVAREAVVSPYSGQAPDGERFAALVAAVAGTGDRMAFAELFSYFAPRVKSYALRGGADPSTAEEIAQDTLAVVWRKAGMYDPAKAAVSTWIFTIARNRRIDLIRREGRAELDSDDPVLSPAAPPPGDAVVAARQAGRLVRNAVGGLPDDQRQVLEMAFFADRTHLEIAAELGLPLGTVKSRIRLALGKLEAALKGTLS